MLLMAFMAPWAAMGQTYTKVTSASGINTTDTYILVYEAGNQVATTSEGSSEGIASAALTNSISNATISASDLPTGTATLTLVQADNKYRIKNQNNYYIRYYNEDLS